MKNFFLKTFNILKSFFISIFSTKELFRYAYKSVAYPIVALIIHFGIAVTPSIISINMVENINYEKEFPYIDDALIYAIKNDGEIKCLIKDNLLICDEGYSAKKTFETKNEYNEDVSYTIFINYNSFNNDDLTLPEYGDKTKPHQNVIILSTNGYSARYVFHDSINSKIISPTIRSSYKNITCDFKDLYTNYDDASLKTFANNFISTGLQTNYYDLVYANTLKIVGSTLIFILFISAIIKGISLISKNKGFTYRKSLKIVCVSQLQASLIAFAVSFILSTDYLSIYIFLLVVRSFYIYFRYTGSTKNKTWMVDLYNEYKDERLNPKNYA